MTDHSNMKLGKLSPRIDSRTLRLAKYLKDLPPPPDSKDNTRGIADWGMMLNDDLGDCTIAACAHAVQVWTANSGTEVTIPDADVLKYYEDWDGYVPSDPNTDQGGVEIDVLNLWRKNGFSGHQLLAYVDPDPKDILHIKQSIVLFGGVYIGLALPLSAQKQEVWDVQKSNWLVRLFSSGSSSDENEPGSWGGHAVFVPAYNQTGPVCITWGQLKQMTWAFWLKYCDEAHTLLSQDLVRAGSIGFDADTLQADLRFVVG